MTNAINWFEIPVKNFERAKQFYSTVLGVEVSEMPMPNMKYGMLPFDMQNGGIGGAIVEAQGMNPSEDGSIVFLNGGDDLSVPLAKVEVAGGKVLFPKTAVGENGFISHFIDTEGNKVAFHSYK